MSRLGGLLRGRDETQPWRGAYQPYDLVKELCIAVGAVTLLVVVVTALFSSPDVPPSTIAQWSRQLPVNFTEMAVAELDGTSKTAEYGPPYNHSNGSLQHAAFLEPQRWLGVSHPIDTANDYVIDPLLSVPGDPKLTAALVEYRGAPASTKAAWTSAYSKYLEKLKEPVPTPPEPVVDPKIHAGHWGPVGTMMNSLLALAQSGGLDGDLLTSRQFFQTDYTRPLLFMADGGLLEARAEKQHLLGNQWGIMNETGSYPGQAWLWLYAFWYQIEPFKSSTNADLLVMLVMAVLSLAFVCIPFLPLIRSIPRRIPIYKLIWREHYGSSST